MTNTHAAADRKIRQALREFKADARRYVSVLEDPLQVEKAAGYLGVSEKDLVSFLIRRHTEPAIAALVKGMETYGTRDWE